MNQYLNESERVDSSRDAVNKISEASELWIE